MYTKKVYNISILKKTGMKRMKKPIYFDHAATTYVKPEVLAKMLPYFTTNFGNPSGIYQVGRENRQAIEDAREQVAGILGCSNREIYFTGSGTEADNWAIRGTAFAMQKKGNHIITTAFEHHAVLHTCQQLEKEGFEVTYIKPDAEGIISAQDIEKAITDKTILITVMFANNEIGTIQPIAEIGKIARAHNILFHTDAVQAVGTIPINVVEMNIDMLSLSAHKFYGPKGAGAIYIRKGVKPQVFIQGGAQESSKRAGTENVPGIVGLAEALRLANIDIEERRLKIAEMRDYLIAQVMQKIPYTKVNGHLTKRLPGNVNFSFNFIEGESLLLMLDLNGIAASSGSACTSGSLDPSHVLLSIGLPHEVAHGSLRVTLGEENTYEEIDYLVEKLVMIVDRLRQMSPLYHE